MKTWHVRFVFFTLLYTGGLMIALVLSFLLRFDFDVPWNEWACFWLICIWIIPLQLACLYGFRQFHVMPGYFGLTGVNQIVLAMLASTVVISIVRFTIGRPYAPPRGVILLDFFFSVAALCGLRVLLRLQREYNWSKVRTAQYRPQKVAIIGAGDAGISLARDLKIKKGLGLQPVAFFDDDPGKWKLNVHDVFVLGPPELLLKPKTKRLGIELAIIALPSAPSKRIKEIVDILNRAHIRFETVPSLDQIAMGKVKVSQIRPVEFQDLLGREPVQLEAGHIRQLLEGRRVMVTGAGGSIGSELCRQIATYNPDKLILVERSEVQLFLIQQELIEEGFGENSVSLVADIMDELRMRWVFQQSHPEIVFHAAAHKHVPMMEDQPDEAVRNNVLGTRLLAELSHEYEVERYVFISTDKAINPTNVMGATKRLAEMFLQAFHASHPQGTKFMAVRFGNVLGSSGSVIPIFKRQIAAGGPVKVTHPEITRFFMTIPEAVGLVLQSGTQGQGGEIFVLDMGQPVKILDLAKQLIELSGFRPFVDIDIEFTGLRPGEKLYEELSYKAENCAPTEHPKIMRFTAQALLLDQVLKRIEHLKAELHQSGETNRLKYLLKRAVPEYKPYVTTPASNNDESVADPAVPQKPALEITQ
jgi:FlaA1/EpsC-like NDP-sugar epimerase